MVRIDSPQKMTYFGNFAVERIASDKANQFELLESAPKEKQAKQQIIFSRIEGKLKFFNADAFQNQVHFQNAALDPVQRWYPYREGYYL
jgi:hypothetical protein